MFTATVCLGMIGRQVQQLDSELVKYGLPQLRQELEIPIRKQDLWNTPVAKVKAIKQSDCPFLSSLCRFARNVCETLTKLIRDRHCTVETLS